MLYLETKVMEIMCTEYNETWSGNTVGWIVVLFCVQVSPQCYPVVCNLTQFCPLILQCFPGCDSSMSKCCHLNSSNQKRPLDDVILHSPLLVLNGRLLIFAFSLDCAMWKLMAQFALTPLVRLVPI